MCTSFASLRLQATAIATLLASTACLSPCPAGPAATAADASGTASGSGESVSSSASSGSSTGTAVPVGGQVIWDGDEVGGNAKSWASCPEGTDCTAKAQVEPGVGRNGGMAVKFAARGKEWMGFGWNLFGWWPADAGYDTTGSKFLSFWMRAEAEKPDLLPELGSIQVMLVSSGEGENRDSAAAELQKYTDSNVLDGKWHEVKVPFEIFNGEKKGANYNAGKVWEFKIGTWSPMPKDFALYFDDIALQ